MNEEELLIKAIVIHLLTESNQLVKTGSKQQVFSDFLRHKTTCPNSKTQADTDFLQCVFIPCLSLKTLLVNRKHIQIPLKLFIRI